MAEFVVHGIPGSPFGRAVLATLEEKGAAWRLSPVAPGAHRQAPHITRHPFGRVPVLDHGDFQLYETQAILRYLDRVLPHPPLTPADPRSAARMDLVMAVSDWYLFQGGCSVIGFHRIVAPRLLGAAPDEAAIEAAMPRAKTAFDELARLLGGQAFMAGDALSLADLHVAPQLSMMAMTPEWERLAGSHPGLLAWLSRIEARASFEATTWARVDAMAEAA